MAIGGSARGRAWIGRVVAACLAVALGVPLAACAPGAAPTGSAGGATPSPVQSIDWRECDDGFECAALTVPLDWDRPADGRTIELAVIRRPADGPEHARLGSLFVNPGGPGVSGVDAMREGWDGLFSARLAERFDLVSWDPRGVGASAPVVCASGPVEVERQLYDITEPSWLVDPEGWKAAQAARERAYLQACLRGTGEVLAHIGTAATVRDLDLLRALVGDERLHYLGFSYGTLLGQRYIERFPDRVGRVVFDGVVDPTVDRLDFALQQEAGFELALRRFVADCLEREDCPLPSGPEQALAAIEELLLRLEAAPVPASDPADGRRLGAGTMRLAMSHSLYRERDWELLAQMLRELTAVPPITDTAFQQADAYTGFVRGEGLEDNMMHALDAITCADVAVVDDPDRLAEYARQLREAAPTLGAREPPMPTPPCVGWPRTLEASPPSAVREATPLPPILVVSTTGDPATPHEWGVRVADRLDSGVLITHHGDGHTAYLRGGPGAACIEEVIDAYLLTGAVPARDPHCGR